MAHACFCLSQVGQLTGRALACGVSGDGFWGLCGGDAGDDHALRLYDLRLLLTASELRDQVGWGELRGLGVGEATCETRGSMRCLPLFFVACPRAMTHQHGGSLLRPHVVFFVVD